MNWPHQWMPPRGNRRKSDRCRHCGVNRTPNPAIIISVGGSNFVYKKGGTFLGVIEPTCVDPNQRVENNLAAAAEALVRTGVCTPISAMALATELTHHLSTLGYRVSRKD